MKSPLLYFVTLCILTPVSAQKYCFEYHEIGNFLDRMGATSLIDVDRDNDLDWVFGSFGEMYWYEFDTDTVWILHELGTGAKTDVGGCPIDINNDGWIDYVVGDSWYENSTDPKNKKFILHKKNMISSHDNVAVDIDQDGIKDIVSVSNHPDHPVLAWYRIPEDYTSNWDYTKIGEGIHGGIAPQGFGDLDGDSDMDVVMGNIWFENYDGRGLWWKSHKTLIPEGGNRPDIYGLALRTWTIDLDKDGDLDIIEAEADTKNGRVFWFENRGNAESFVYHPISSDSTFQDFHSLSVADFDNDGDFDVLSGGGPLTQGTRRLFIWESISTDGLVWNEHQISSGFKIHETVAADVDQDGDIDICTKPWDGDLHVFLENKLID